MVRFKILASAVPLLVAAVVAGAELLPGARPCIAIGETSVQHGPADYRIFVKSKRFSARDAAALVVGAGAGHRLAAASL